MALLILLLQLTQTVPLLLQQVLFLQPQQPQPQPQLPQQPLPPQVLPNKAVFQVIQLRQHQYYHSYTACGNNNKYYRKYK